MGDLRNINAWLLAALATLFVFASAPAWAEAERAPVTEPAATAVERAVSTSPENRPRSEAMSVQDSRDVTAGLPLTRAATRQRIESMTPVGWLSTYGSIVVGRSE